MDRLALAAYRPNAFLTRSSERMGLEMEWTQTRMQYLSGLLGIHSKTDFVQQMFRPAHILWFAGSCILLQAPT